MTMNLQELEAAATARLDEQFRAGTDSPDLKDFNRPFWGDREVDLTAAGAVIEEAMRRFPVADRAASDSWLGPRLHAALRLSRREASRPGVWRYLGVCAFPEYVRWRFADVEKEEPPGLERFTGAETKHALGRLWWMAEMFRDGADYEPAAKALSNQDVINNLFKNDTAHHRPTVQGAVRILVPGGGRPARTGREANALAKAINATAATVLLDAYAPDEPLDDDARKRWVEEGKDHDPALYFDQLPEGPDDPVTPPESVERMEKLLADLMQEAPVRGQKPDQSEPAEAVASP